MRYPATRIALALAALCWTATPLRAQSRPTLASLTVSPSRVTGGDPSQGTVTLSGPALGDGALVALSSSDPSVAAVPSSALIKPRTNSVSFRVDTRSVRSEKVIEIAATYQQVRKSARLLVEPPAPSPAQMTGLVFRDANGNGRPDGGEAVVPGATVELWHTTSLNGMAQRLQSQQTDQQGRYRFTNVMPINGPLPDFGCYQVRLTSPDPGAGIISSSSLCQVPSGATVTVDFPLRTSSAPALSAEIRTDRGCLGQGQNPGYQAGEKIQFLFSITGPSQAEVTLVILSPSGRSQVVLEPTMVKSGQTYRVTRAVGQTLGQWKVQLTATVPGTQGGALAQAACSFTVRAAPAPFQQVLAVGDPVAATGRLGIFGPDPLDPDRNVSAIRRVAEDGSVYVADYAGASLLRFSAGTAALAPAARRAGSEQARIRQAPGPQVLLDTSRQDPVDGIGLARILQVETGRDGTSALLALRADNSRALYRLEKGALTRLALLPGTASVASARGGPVELAIGDAGQIAFIAPLTPEPSSTQPFSPLALFQTVRGRPVVQFRQAQVIGDMAITGIRSLQSNGRGVVSYLLDLRRADGTVVHAVMRGTPAGHAVVAVTGRPDDRLPGPLTDLRRPRIGPDGTVVFLGIGDGFVNVYADGPDRPFRPLLRADKWNPADGTYDFEIAEDGTVAVRAALGQATESLLYLVPRAGGMIPIPGGEGIVPVGQPVFVPRRNDSLLFFLAKNVNRPQLRDRNGRLPLVLCRSRLVDGKPKVDAAAVPGQPLPGKPGVQLLTMLQRPVVAQNTVFFSALSGGKESLAVPTAGLFRAPLDGKPEEIRLVAEEGADLAGAERLALLRDFSFAADGGLAVGGLMPGAGPLVVAVPGPASPTRGGRPPAARPANGVARTQATPPGPFTPLLAIGQPLDRPGRRLLAILGRLIALGSSQQLLVARFSQDGGTPGEGLFTVDRNGLVQVIAVTGDPVPGLAGAQFAGFSDTATYTVNPPSVSLDGNLVFKAHLKLMDGTGTDGVFQWRGTVITAIGLSQPNPDNMKLTADDQPPYDLFRWAAGPSGHAYLIERHQTRLATRVARLFDHATASLAALVVPGVTPVLGGSPTSLNDLSDCVINNAGTLFVQGGGGPGLASVLAVGPSGLTPLARQGQQIPTPADGTPVQGLFFSSRFELQPASANGPLLFRAGLARLDGSDSGMRGMFRVDSQGLKTLLVETLQTDSARTTTLGTLGDSPKQARNGIVVVATFWAGRWTITEFRENQTTVVAQDGQTLMPGKHIMSLDPSALLNLPPGSGPVFTLNDAGDVAFMASDGRRWGIYLFTNGG